MASNNLLVMQIVLQDGRDGVTEKQKQEIIKLQRDLFDAYIEEVVPRKWDVTCEARARLIVDHVLPVHSQSVKHAVICGFAQPTLVEDHEDQLALYRKRIQDLKSKLS